MTYWVIKAKTLYAGQEGWVSRAEAHRYSTKAEAVTDKRENYHDCRRIVRVVRKAKAASYSTEQLAEQVHASFNEGRLAALEEAERVCRDAASSEVGRESMAVNDVADSIAALRSK